MPSTDIKCISVIDRMKIILTMKDPRFSIRAMNLKTITHCYLCGNDGLRENGHPINDELSKEWKLSEEERAGFDIRESSICQHCGGAYRSNLHAKIITKLLAPKQSSSLALAVSSGALNKYKIAEINFCGTVHPVISNLPNLTYSEYMPNDKDVRSEDLLKLTYATDSFDVVLTSDTLEHVPDWIKACTEIHRVLKTGGKHIFTIPMILNRKTRNRIIKDSSGQFKHLLPPSHHGLDKNNRDDYLVHTEFGGDAVDELEKIGFNVNIYGANVLNLSDPNFVIVAEKKLINGVNQ